MASWTNSNSQKFNYENTDKYYGNQYCLHTMNTTHTNWTFTKQARTLLYLRRLDILCPIACQYRNHHYETLTYVATHVLHYINKHPGVGLGEYNRIAL